MKISEVKKIENQVDIFVSVDQSSWKIAQDKYLTNSSKTIKVKGYRPGHVPVQILKKMINPAEIYSGAVNIIANSVIEFIDASKEAKNITEEVYPKPALDIVKVDDAILDLKISYSFIPTVKISDYDKLGLNLTTKKVTSEEIENELNYLISSKGIKETKKDGSEIKLNDIVFFDFIGYIDGKPFDGGKADNFELKIGSKSFIPGFEDAMIGLKVADHKKIDLNFPKDYHVKTLAGKAVMFDVTINKIVELKEPTLNDEFALSLKFDSVKNVAELKKFINENIQNQYDKQDHDNNVGLISKKLIEIAKVTPIPVMMLEDEFENVFREFNSRLKQMNTNYDSYLKMINKSDEDMRKDLLAEAELKIKLYLILNQIALQDNVKADESLIAKKTSELAKLYHMDEDELIKKIGVESVGELLITETVIKNLIKANSK